MFDAEVFDPVLRMNQCLRKIFLKFDVKQQQAALRAFCLGGQCGCLPLGGSI